MRWAKSFMVFTVLLLTVYSVVFASETAGMMKSVEGVSNFKEFDGKIFYRPLTESEMSGIVFDSLDSMNIYNNEYTIGQLKLQNPYINWENWMQLKWGKFDWNDKNHDPPDAYWQDYDGNTAATAQSYADALQLRLPTEAELKLFFSHLEGGLEADLGWPSGYYWTSDVSEDGSGFHRFVDSQTNFGQHYNDTRDYFVILVGDESLPSVGIYPSSQKLAGMNDIPGVSNSISVDGVLIYRPLTTGEVEALLGEGQYDFSLPGKYGYSLEKTDAYTVTLDERKAEYREMNSEIDWDAWFELEWPLYDDSFSPSGLGLGESYEGNYYATGSELFTLYPEAGLTYTPKYIMDKLLEAYPDGQITAVFGWPTNLDYVTSSKDEFGNVYTTSLYIENSRIHRGAYDPCYISFVKYADIDPEKLVESSTR